MDQWERVLYSLINPNEQYGEVLSESLEEFNMSITEFSEESSISESLLYKITSGHRNNIQIDNFRKIVRAVKRIEQGSGAGEWSVAVITNRESLEGIRNYRNVKETEVVLEEYPCSTVEEAIKQSVLAERDGVDAIVCGPITAYTIEDIVYIPVVGLDVQAHQVDEAIDRALQKAYNVDEN